jgi:hypothetical protein
MHVEALCQWLRWNFGTASRSRSESFFKCRLYIAPDVHTIWGDTLAVTVAPTCMVAAEEKQLPEQSTKADPRTERLMQVPEVPENV